MSKLVLNGDVSGSVTLDAPAVSGTTTLTLPTTSGTVLTTANTFGAGTGPAFRASASSPQSLTNSTNTKITLDVEIFDTNNNFASSRFTPTVAGYYLFTGVVTTNVSANNTNLYAQIFKNALSIGTTTSVGTVGSYPSANPSAIVYMNGTTDYVELYAQTNSGTVSTAPTVFTAYDSVYFQGVLVRGA